MSDAPEKEGWGIVRKRLADQVLRFPGLLYDAIDAAYLHGLEQIPEARAELLREILTDVEGLPNELRTTPTGYTALIDRADVLTLIRLHMKE